MNNFKLSIIGYGRMGQEIEKQAKDQGISIHAIIDDKAALESSDLSGSVAIEFSQPDAAFDNLCILAKRSIPTICGTTGWYDQIETLRKEVKANNSAFLYASNFALGVHGFWNVVKQAAQTFNKLDDFDVFLHEIHHKNKKDSPSGTALSTADIVLSAIDRKTAIVTERLDRAPQAHEIHVSSTRGGDVFGDHIVTFDSPDGTIEITHKSKGRSGYAQGAINCAKWLADKNGFYSIDDYLKEIF